MEAVSVALSEVVSVGLSPGVQDCDCDSSDEMECVFLDLVGVALSPGVPETV